MSGLSPIRPLVFRPPISANQAERNANNQPPSNRPLAVTNERAGDDLAVRSAQDLGVGSRGPEVIAAQEALTDAGYSPGASDGIFGPKTLAAAQQFQQDRIDTLTASLRTGPGLERAAEDIGQLQDELAQGVIGDATKAQLKQLDSTAKVLGNTDITLGVGSRGGDVVALQEDLNAAGYESGEADGIYGPMTGAAVEQFQADRINQLEAALAAPIGSERAQINEQLTALRNEKSQSVAGEQTQAQLKEAIDPGVFPTPDNDENPGPNADLPPSPNGEPQRPIDQEDDRVDSGNLPDIDFPGRERVENTIDAIQDGDIHEALEQGLNSKGDSVSIDLGASVSVPVLPPPIPIAASFEPEIGASVTVAEDGTYDLSLDFEIATKLGIVADPDDINVNGGIKAGSKATFNFDTLEEVQQGVSDLIVTAGKNELAVEAVALGAEATQLADRTADRLIEFLGDQSIAGRNIEDIVGPIDAYVDGLINDLPDEIRIEVPDIDGPNLDFGPFNGPDLDINTPDVVIPLGRFAQPFADLRGLRKSQVEAVQQLAERQEEAIENLDDAFESVEVSYSSVIDGDLGLPVPGRLKNLALRASAGTESGVTATYNKDGTIELQYGFSQSGGIEAGAGIGGALSEEHGITLTQKFTTDGGGISTVGDFEVAFNGNVEALARAGVGVTGEAGVGAEFRLSVGAQQVGGQLNDAVENFLAGDFELAFDDLGAIEADIELSGKAIGAASFEIGPQVFNAEVSVNGGIRFEDRTDFVNEEDLTIAEAFEFLQEQVDDAQEVLLS